MIDLQDIQIPPLSTVTVRVMQFDPLGETASSQGLEKIIAPDEGICSDLLRIANSAYYGRSGRVKTLRDAITLLGLKTVKNLVILLASKSMNNSLKGKIFLSYLNEFTITCALVAEELCEKMGFKQYKEEAFLGALLHKIGMTILALDQKKTYSDLIENAEKNFADLIEEERKVFGIDHVEVGKLAFEKWNIPEALQEVIADHNFPASDVANKPDLVRITALASLTTREMMGLLLSMPDLERRASLAAHYNVVDVVGSYNEGKYNQIKEHPFYKQVVGQ